ncbi:MAG: hypothetical protein CL907_00225 [Dehalococcoidia bacterium]|nr:hypothetical protein [Dehalococcoidia bacterium]|tara:strand:- start:129 stop:314 length:186 start_codon:yes stop_codon:yes gene_type:complete
MNSEIVNLLKNKYNLDNNDLEIVMSRINELEEAVKKIKGVEIIEDLAQLNPITFCPAFYNE